MSYLPPYLPFIYKYMYFSSDVTIITIFLQLPDTSYLSQLWQWRWDRWLQLWREAVFNQERWPGNPYVANAVRSCTNAQHSIHQFPSVDDINKHRYNGACLWVSHNAFFRNSQRNSVNDSIYDFDWVFLEIPVKYCIIRKCSQHTLLIDWFSPA